MNLKETVALVCLLAFDVCDAYKFLPRRSGHPGGLSRRQEQEEISTQLCSPCDLEPIQQLQPVFDVLQDLGQTVREVKGYVNEILDTTFDTKDDLQGAIEQTLGNILSKLDLILGKLITAAENLDSCIPLKTLLVKFRTQLEMIPLDLIETWGSKVTDTDPEYVFDALAKAVAIDIPIFVKLIRDTMFRFTDVFLPTDDCESLAPIIFEVVNPDGKLAAILTQTLNSSGNAATDLLNNIFGSILIKGGIAEEGLDMLYIIQQLLCGGLRVINVDAVEATGGFCPTTIDAADYETVIYQLLCGIVNLAGKQVFPDGLSICKPA